jgi:hypothetical protein
MKKNKASGQICFNLESPEYESAAVVAKALYDHDCLDEPSLEALALRTLRIIIEEYAENPGSLISYYKRKKKS